MSAVIDFKPGDAAPSIDLQEAIAFIWREADRLDRLDYQSWLRMWAPGGLYIIPTERDATDYADRLNIVYDDGEMRQARVKRLLSGFAMSSAPPAHTVRTISRFVIADSDDNGIALRAAMILAEYKYERMRVLAADLDYRLVRKDGALGIARKIVRLINQDDFLHGLGYLL